MRNHPARRLAAALLNLFFLLAWGEPVTLRPCPAHDGVVVASAMAGAAMSHHAMAHDASSATPAEHEHHGTPGGGHVCHCLGQCCAAMGVVAPTAQAIRWQVVVHRLAAPAYDEPATPAAASPRLLPFANGPPRTA
jgi:hypothetical protein